MKKLIFLDQVVKTLEEFKENNFVKITAKKDILDMSMNPEQEKSKEPTSEE